MTLGRTEVFMSLLIHGVAPDFTSDSTQGPLSFHAWQGHHWVIFFSHPKDFTPVCTTELATVARLHGAFAERNAKALALSVDSVEDHHRWIVDIEATQGIAPNFPILADPERRVAQLYGMLPAGAPDSFTVRSVYFIDPAHRIRASLTYPAATGRNFDEILRVLDGLQLTDRHAVATPANWRPGGEVVIVPSIQDPDELARRFPQGFRAERPWLRWTRLPSDQT
jgi:alkyl hydroperoxide reductase subunit AhpC